MGRRCEKAPPARFNAPVLCVRSGSLATSSRQRSSRSASAPGSAGHLAIGRLPVRLMPTPCVLGPAGLRADVPSLTTRIASVRLARCLRGLD